MKENENPYLIKAVINLTSNIEKHLFWSNGNCASFHDSLISDLRQGKKESGRPLTMCVALGDYEIFRILFYENIPKNSRSLIDEKVQEILSWSHEIDDLKLRSKFDKILTSDFRSMLATYEVNIEEFLKESNRLDDITQDDLDNWILDLDYLAATRPVADRLLTAFRRLGHPDEIPELSKKMKMHDESLKAIYHRAFIKSPNSFDSRIWMTEPDARFQSPPEIEWWYWMWLERKERKPLHEIFGFDPEEVKRKLETLNPEIEDR